jgi:predicted membrane protein
MRAIRNLIGLVFGVTFLTALISAISAAVLKRRLPSRGGELDDEIALVTIYSGLDFTSRAQSFRGGSVLTWYGGGTLDLRDAILDPAGAHLTVRAIFGGFRLVVPETWRVENRMMAIFGGVGDARDSSAVLPDRPTLVLDGLALFGGVGIVSEAPDLDHEIFSTTADIASEVPAPAPA